MALADWFLTPEERNNPHSRIDAIHPEVGWTVGNVVTPLIHGRPYFAELHARVSELREGDRLYFTDWRGDPEELLTDAEGETLSATFAAAAERGVEVRGLLWRSHWRYFGFQADKHRFLGEEIERAGGQCLRDMRVRTLGSHHQKLVVLRHRDDPTRDVAFVGGIDLARSRRDDSAHHGDPQTLPMAAAFGPTPAWHDVQVAIQGPAVHDVETTFRERWEDSTPLTLNPGRILSSLLQGEDQIPRALGEQWPPPPPVPGGHEVIEVVRTYPAIQPVGYDFAPDGERTIALANAKAIARAARFVYVEDQYFWSEQVGDHFAAALEANPDLHLAVVLPEVPDMDGLLGEKSQFYARRLALTRILDAGGDRVAVFGLTNDAGLPVYVHSKVCVIDDRWASVGSDNLNRRSWTSDSEVAALVMDDRAPDDWSADAPAPRDSFPVRIRTELVAEHLGCAPADVPEDPVAIFEAMVAAADALDSWYAAGGARRAGRLRTLSRSAARHTRRKKGHRMARARTRAAAGGERVTGVAAGIAERPPGRLRRIGAPELRPVEERMAAALYPVVDPDGTVLRDEDLREISSPDVGPDRERTPTI